MAETGSSIRIDKWLWHARFYKTRSLATKIVSEGKVRIDGTPISKPARQVGPGAVLTFVKEGDVKIVRILAVGERRGPAPEAQALYEDLSPPPEEKSPLNPSFDGKGKPGKRERRNMDALRAKVDPFALE